MENHDIRLKRLLYRSVYTGTKETDVFLGKFAQSQLSHLSIELLDQYESLVENSDPDLFMWISGQKTVPERWDNEIMVLLKNFNTGL